MCDQSRPSSTRNARRSPSSVTTIARFAPNTIVVFSSSRDGIAAARAALVALAAILVITAAWWALALWPAGAVEPE